MRRVRSSMRASCTRRARLAGRQGGPPRSVDARSVCRADTVDGANRFPAIAWDRMRYAAHPPHAYPPAGHLGRCATAGTRSVHVRHRRTPTPGLTPAGTSTTSTAQRRHDDQPRAGHDRHRERRLASPGSDRPGEDAARGPGGGLVDRPAAGRVRPRERAQHRRRVPRARAGGRGRAPRRGAAADRADERRGRPARPRGPEGLRGQPGVLRVLLDRQRQPDRRGAVAR